jgi:hypothetical protein
MKKECWKCLKNLYLIRFFNDMMNMKKLVKHGNLMFSAGNEDRIMQSQKAAFFGICSVFSFVIIVEKQKQV